MKILAISNSWPGPGRLVGNVFFKQCLEGLVAEGHCVEALAPRAWVRDPPARRVGGVIKVHEPRFLSLSNFSLPWGGNTLRWGQWFNARACRRYAERHLEKPGVIYGKFMSTCAAARSLHGVFGSPWVVSVGESIWDWKHHLIPQFGRVCLGNHLKAAYGIETVSEELKGFLQTEFKVSPKKVACVPNGVCSKVFCPGDQRKAREELGLPHEIFYVAFIGRADVNKGAERVLQAIHQLPKGRETKALMMGVPSSWEKRHEVAFAGELPVKTVPLYLQAADIFVLPTTNEGMCNSLLEALSVGLPVVTSDLAFNREVLNQDEGILIDPLDAGAISEAIRQLREEGDLREKMGKVSRSVAAKFSMTRRVERAEGFLTEIAAKGRQCSGF